MSKSPPETPPQYAAIYDVVRRIPRGKVATYGQVARLAGLGRSARQVGYALFRLPEKTRIPWQRVVNAQAMVSTLPFLGGPEIQRAKLRAEGIRFDANDRIDFAKFRWTEGL
ncbi:MAG: MGMT family protein [Deltaproteobacteria bacterium]|nr:MGMT family protein [Deltaproteobacteria bacterium]